jgi:hypothetical protein
MVFSTLAMIVTAAASLTASAADLRREAPSAEPPSTGAVACTAPAPVLGEPFAGPVLHVFDGHTLCVAQGPTPSEWIRVKLDLGSGSDARSALMAAVFAKRVVCVAHRDARVEVVANCVVDGVPLNERLESPAIRTDAAFWR